MENHTIVTLKKGEGRTIKAGGAWIFDNEIDTITGTFKNGDVVNVHDFDGYPMGKGFINQNSKIRIRMMTRHSDQDIDTELSEMLQYIKSKNPDMQMIAVGDMQQKIYDKTSLDIRSFISTFLGNHIQLSFTKFQTFLLFV